MRKGGKIAVIIGLFLFVVAVIVVGFLEFFVYIPKATVNIVGTFEPIKQGSELAVKYELRNLSMVNKSFLVVPEIVNQKDSTSIALNSEKIDLMKDEMKAQEFKYPLTEATDPGKYLVRINVKGKDGLIRSTYSSIASAEQEFLVETRLSSAKIAIKGVKGEKKTGRKIDILGAVTNTGEVPLSIAVKMSVKHETQVTDFPPKRCDLSPGASADFSVTYTIPDSSGKYDITAEAAGENRVLSRAQEYFTVAQKITKAAIKLAGISGDKKVGSDLTVAGEVTNTGETEHNFPVKLTITDPSGDDKIVSKEISLNVGETKPISFTYAILKEAPAGNYRFKMGVYNGVDEKGQLFECFGESASGAEIKSLVFRGGVEILGDIPDCKYGTDISVKIRVKNTGEVRSIMPVKVELVNSEGTSVILETRAEPAVGQSVELEAKTKITNSMPDGKYEIKAQAWEKFDAAGLPQNPAGTATKTFMVNDEAPVVSMVSNLPKMIGKKSGIRANVSDDKKIDMVKIIYQGPGMTAPASDLMEKISGTDQEGVWAVEMRAFTKTGNFTCTVAATDSKGQKTKSKEYKVEIVR